MVQTSRGLVQNYNHTALQGQGACHEPLQKAKFQELSGRADTWNVTKVGETNKRVCVMPTEIVDGWAVKQLRELYRLDRSQAARLCGLTLGQIKQLEEGGHNNFASPADKIQAAMLLASTLSGKQPNGLPRANVFYVGNSPVLGNRYSVRPEVSLKQERFIDSPKFLKTALIAFVMLFLLFGVATPILFGKKSAPYLDGVPVIEKLPVIK